MFHKWYRHDVQLVHQMFNDSDLNEDDIYPLNESVEIVYSVLHGGSHFVVMEMQHRTRRICIFGGSGYSLNTGGGV
jgi:hypothetical protein